MPNLTQSREAFRQGVRRSTPREEQQFLSILDDFIAWSESRNGLKHADHDYEQGVVSFRESSGLILWSAYPKDKDGAKLEILPGSADKLTEETHRLALEILKGMTEAPLSVDTTLRIRFAALRSSAKRVAVKSLFEALITDLGNRAALS